MNWIGIIILIIVIAIVLYFLSSLFRTPAPTPLTPPVVPIAPLPPLKLADEVNLSKYAGLWYEIARLPVPFQDFGPGVRCQNSTAPILLQMED